MKIMIGENDRVIKKLIPLIDYIDYLRNGFVTEEIQKEIGDIDLTKVGDQKFSKVVRYVDFLKQKLELWMFVPTGKDGNVLEEPESKDYGEHGVGRHLYVEALAEYQKAKDRVLFKNVVLDYASGLNNESFGVMVDGIQVLYYKSLPDYWLGLDDKTLEDLTHLNLELTDKAL